MGNLNRRLFLVCLRYTPGMWQHMSSFARCMLNQGMEVNFLIADRFRWMNNNFNDITFYLPDNIKTQLNNISFVKKYFSQQKPSAILFVSWHPLNYYFAYLIKQFSPHTIVIVWLHEPYKEEKWVYGLKAIIIFLVEFFQTLSIRHIDVVILHSRRAMRLFEKRYPKFDGIKKMIPLGFQDDGLSAGTERRYVSFLGRADRAKGIEGFFALVEAAAQQDANLRFQIVTSSDIQIYLQNLSPNASRLLHVVNPAQLSDNELRLGAASSLAVLSLYHETMQSGVIPVALMKGTPVVGTDIEGITEWIEDKKTGVIVSTSPTCEEIIEALHYIREHFSEMSRACRLHYLETFDDRNWERYYGWLKELIETEEQTK